MGKHTDAERAMNLQRQSETFYDPPAVSHYGGKRYGTPGEMADTIDELRFMARKLYHMGGLMEWLNMHNEPLADELAEAARAER